MTEAYLHHLFNSRKLGKSFQTTAGEKMEVLSFGRLNKSSGPDFLEAMVQFDNKVWAGHIEFHLKSSDWIKHGHQHDKAYGNVIAHFVFEHDKEIFVNDFKLPVVELKEQIDTNSFEQYQKWIVRKSWIPCESQIKDVHPEVIQNQLEVALDQRIKRKTTEAVELIKTYQMDEKMTFFHLLSRSLGGRYNQEAMITLFEKVQFATIEDFSYDDEKINTYLRALSGLDHSKEAERLVAEYGLLPMDHVQWRTFGMHPPGRPLNRIKELALLVAKSYDFQLFSKPQDWRKFLQDLSASMQNNILINVVYPLLQAKNFYSPNEKRKDELDTWLQQLEPENNKLIRQWNDAGLNALNAADSQSLIELKNEFCSQKKCLFCGVGKSVLE